MKTLFTQSGKIALLLVTLLLAGTAEGKNRFHEKLDSIQLRFDHRQLRLPGESFDIEIIAYYKNGKVKSTRNFLKDAVAWGRFKIEITGGNFAAGKVYVNASLQPSKGKYIQVVAYPGNDKGMKKTLLLPLNYEEHLEVVPTSKLVKAPGYDFKFKVRAQYDNGQIWDYNYRLLDRLGDEFTFYTEGGSLHVNKFVIDHDFRNITDHQVILGVIPKNNPALTEEYHLKLDYRAEYVLSYSGENGYHGRSGANGKDGKKGQRGQRGQNGENGGFGQDGPAIGVWADVYYDTAFGGDLMYIHTENYRTGAQRELLVNPYGGSLHVVSNGGNGGHGGSGGNGGKGGEGLDGRWRRKVIAVNDSTSKTIHWQEPGFDGEKGGNGGFGGHGGHGGFGGDIYLFLTADAAQVSYVIVPDSNGGMPGSGASGGNGGQGGKGGTGDEGRNNGEKGKNGKKGLKGESGWWGSSGNIIYERIEDFVHYEPLSNR